MLPWSGIHLLSSGRSHIQLPFVSILDGGPSSKDDYMLCLLDNP